MKLISGNTTHPQL